MAKKAKRIIFSFDEVSERELVDVAATAGFSSKARAVREAVGLFHRLQEYQKQGFTQLVVRNPDKNEEIEVRYTALDLSGHTPSE
jgi:hypothetical protein